MPRRMTMMMVRLRIFGSFFKLIYWCLGNLCVAFWMSYHDAPRQSVVHIREVDYFVFPHLGRLSTHDLLIEVFLLFLTQDEI
jgi:hypothetical protein